VSNPYYIVPDGHAGTQAFAVIRDSLEKEGMVGIGRVVFTTREHTIAPEARGKDILGATLRYPYEVRDKLKYFDDIPSERKGHARSCSAYHQNQIRPFQSGKIRGSLRAGAERTAA
jgi:non-homologous end joining protein Ku